MTANQESAGNFDRRVKNLLDQKTRELPQHTVGELQFIRKNALQHNCYRSNHHKNFIMSRLGAPAAYLWGGGIGIAFASIALTVVLVGRPPQQPMNTLPSEDDFSFLLTVSDDLEFYEHLEFYQWLEEFPVGHERHS